MPSQPDENTELLNSISAARDKALPAKPYDFQSLGKLPRDEEPLLAKFQEINQNLNALFEERLPPSDREVWRTGPEEKRQHLWTKFDDFLIEMAGVMGTRILCSLSVQKRMSQWEYPEHDGVKRLRQFFEAIILRARVGRAEASYPIKGPRFRWTKEAAKPELRALLSRARENFCLRHRAPEFSDVSAFLIKEIEDHPEDFPFLTTAASGFRQYLLYLKGAADSESKVALRRLVNGNMRPEKLFDLWGAWATSHSTETFRVLVSKAGSHQMP